MKRAFILAAPLVLAACTSILPDPAFPPPPPIWGNASATIGFDGQAMLNGLIVRPLALVEDSRCPAQVQCIWAGRLRVRVLVSDPAALARGGDANAPTTAVGEERTFILGEPTLALGRLLVLSAAAPAPVAGQPIDPRAYRFTFTMPPAGV